MSVHLRHRETVSINIKSSALTKLQKIKGTIDEKKQVEEVKEQERNHEFLKLEDKMKEDRGKEYKFDHKRIQEIRERELRALQRRNQYQLAEMKKDEEQSKKLRIIDHWNYKERFQQIQGSIPERNPFFNRSSIESYIGAAFEVKQHDEKPHPTMLPSVRNKKSVQLIIPERTELESNFNSVSNLSTSPHHQGSTFMIQETSIQSHATHSGRAFFSNTLPPSPKNNNFQFGMASFNPNTDSTVVIGEQSQASLSAVPKRYNKRDMFETLRGMDYGSIFAAQAPLTDFTKKFNIENIDTKQKANMIQDVLDYLDMDLMKVRIARDQQNRSVLVRGSKLKQQENRNSTRTQSQTAIPKVKNPSRMPNVYMVKELPSQKAILSPRIQRGLAKSESLHVTKIKQYKFVGKQPSMF